MAYMYRVAPSTQNRTFRYYFAWGIFILIGIFIPFIGVPLAVMMKSDEDERYRSLLIVSLIAGFIHLGFAVYGFMLWRADRLESISRYPS